jgi:hypothetical protein
MNDMSDESEFHDSFGDNAVSESDGELQQRVGQEGQRISVWQLIRFGLIGVLLPFILGALLFRFTWPTAHALWPHLSMRRFSDDWVLTGIVGYYVIGMMMPATSFIVRIFVMCVGVGPAVYVIAYPAIYPNSPLY